jgi:hypothetical protein
MAACVVARQQRIGKIVRYDFPRIAANLSHPGTPLQPCHRQKLRRDLGQHQRSELATATEHRPSSAQASFRLPSARASAPTTHPIN